MAKLGKFLVLCLLLAAFVGVLGDELSAEADKTASLVNKVAEKMLQREILDGVDKMFVRKMKTSETARQMFLKEIVRGSVLNCGETCLLGTCYTTGCTCNKYRVCTKDSLPDAAAALFA